jgi:hypothetical protein
MPPKTVPLPNIMFVSDDKDCALYHHTKHEDILDMIMEHIKTKALYSDLPEQIDGDNVNQWIFQFMMLRIDCDSNLRFIKRETIYTPLALMSFVSSFREKYLDKEADECVNSMVKESTRIYQVLREELKEIILKRFEHTFE